METKRRMIVIHKGTAIGTSIGFLGVMLGTAFFLGGKVNQVQETLGKVPMLSQNISDCNIKIGELNDKMDKWSNSSKNYWTVSEMRAYNNQLRNNNPAIKVPTLSNIKDD